MPGGTGCPVGTVTGPGRNAAPGAHLSEHVGRVRASGAVTKAGAEPGTPSVPGRSPQGNAEVVGVRGARAMQGNGGAAGVSGRGRHGHGQRAAMGLERGKGRPQMGAGRGCGTVGVPGRGDPPSLSKNQPGAGVRAGTASPGTTRGEMRERRKVVSVLAEGEQSGSGSRQPQPLPFPRRNELQAAGAASLPRAAAPGAPSPAHAPRLLLTSAHRLGLGACKFLAKPGPKISGGGRRSALGEGDEIFSCGREGGCSAAGGGAVPGSSSCRPPGNSPGINLAPANLVAGLGTEAPEGARGTRGGGMGVGLGLGG